MTDRLTGPQLEDRLKALPNWSLADSPDGPKLHRVFQFGDFREAFGFMAAAATAAEAQNHHPEWRNVYRTVEVWLTTHDADGITDKDFELAREMDRLSDRSR